MNPLSGQSTFNFAGIGQTNLTNQIQTAQPQSQPQSNLFGNLFQKPANNLLTGQNPQTQNSLFPTQNNQQTNLGQGGISQNIPNVANQNVSHDFLRSKLLTHKISKESQDEMYSKLVKDYSEFSKNNSIKNKLQLESLDLNLDCLDHMILPDYLKFKKSLFQLLALTDNDKKDIYKNTNLDITKAQTFLSDQGINLTKIDKDINELKNYLISNYDFSSDLNNINLSDKNIIDDKVKMHLNTTTNSLWARTNENLIFADNNQRRSNNLNYFKKIIKFQNSEMEFLNDMGLFSTPYGNGGYNPKSSAEKFTSNFNYDENNKYNYSANLQNFNLINSEYGKKVNFQSNIDNFKSNQSQINKFPSRQGQENLKNFNPSNFTPLKVMNLNFANAGFGMNKIKNLNKLSSSNKQTGQDFYNLANKKTEILKKIYAGGTYNQYSNSSMENYNVNDYQNLNSNTNINKTNNKANFSTLDYIENLKMINFKNFAGAEADGNKVAQFSSYFDNLKTYFYYKVKSEIIIENQPLLITNSDLENFYSIKEEQLKNNILPMTIAINKLCLFFEQTKDFSRKNLFSLLYCQIRCLNKNFKNSNLTPENVLYNTIKFYESEFLKKILLNVDTPLLKNKSEIDIYNMDFEFKFSCVEKFATNLLLQNFSSKINSNIPNFNLYQNQGAFGYDKYSKADLEKMKKWTIIYVFIRAGLIKDCVIYISSIIKNFYENQSFEGNYNRDNDIEPFLELLKQIYSDTKIDENLYSLLSDSMKNKNLRDEEPFKFCCLNLILKINNPINENVFLNFEDYIWYHLNLIFKKKNFLELTEKKFLNLKYLSLAEFQTFVLNSDPNIFNTKNSPNFNLDYATCLFSLLLFEEGLEFILNSQTNIIDGVNIGFILTEINLCKNFCDEELYYELTEFRCYQKTDSLKAKINSFINKISDKRKLIEILLYIKYIFYDQDSQQWLDLFKNTINLFSDYNVLFNGDNVFIAVEDVNNIIFELFKFSIFLINFYF